MSWFQSQGDTKEGECGVLQEIGRDHTEPEFTVFLEAEDDRSNVILTLDVGTVPGGTNVLAGKELGGFSTTLNDVSGFLNCYQSMMRHSPWKESVNIHLGFSQTLGWHFMQSMLAFDLRFYLCWQILQPAGVPLYFSVNVANEAGESVRAVCSLPTYDMTIPGGRMTESFSSTSNPRVLKGTVTVYDDSTIESSRVGVGFGKDIYGEQIVRWTETKIEANNIDYNVGEYEDGNLGELGISPFWYIFENMANTQLLWNKALFLYKLFKLHN